MSLHPASHFPEPGLLQCGLQLQNYLFYDFHATKEVLRKLPELVYIII